MSEKKQKDPARELCRVMRRIYDRELTTLTGGNLSLMDDQGVMWTTPTGIDKASLAPEDIVRVFPDGNTEGKHRPTSEYRIHWRILTQRQDLRAVLHAHSPTLVTMSILYQASNTKLTPLTYAAVGDVRLADYAPPGSMELVDCVGEVFQVGCRAAVLKNHAAFLGSGIDLFDAFRRFEQFDRNACIQLLAPAIGQLAEPTVEELTAFLACLDRPWTERPIRAVEGEEKTLCRTLAGLSRRAYHKGLFTGLQGAISARSGADRFIISPREKDNAYLEGEDFTAVEVGTCSPGYQPDISAGLHQAIYRAYPDVQSVILAGPAYASMFAVCRTPMDCTIIPESFGVLRSMARVPLEVLTDHPESITDYITPQCPAALIDNYGVIVLGASPILAFDKLEVAEFTARSLHQTAVSGGTVHHLSMEELLETLN